MYFLSYAGADLAMSWTICWALRKAYTEASSRLYNHEKKEEFVQTQEASRKLMPKYNSKQDLESLTQMFLY